jgi:transcriptional regulator with XRE-family HTH domain
MQSQSNIIGNYLKQQREAAGLLQREVAEHAGVSYSTISRIESGAVLPTVDVLVSIGACLDLDLTELLAKLGHYSRRSLPELADYLREKYEANDDVIASVQAHFRRVTQEPAHE